MLSKRNLALLFLVGCGTVVTQVNGSGMSQKPLNSLASVDTASLSATQEEVLAQTETNTQKGTSPLAGMFKNMNEKRAKRERRPKKDEG